MVSRESSREVTVEYRSVCLSPRWHAGTARVEYADGKETDCEVTGQESLEEGSAETRRKGTACSVSYQGG